jgi:serine/threonine protein kinase
MLGRIQAVCGTFPRHMLEEGSTAPNFFTPSGLLYRAVDDADESDADESDGDESQSQSTPLSETRESEVDVITPIPTPLAAQLGLPPDVDDGDSIEAKFISFVASLLQVDPSNRPTAKEALLHPFIRDTLEECLSIEDEQLNGIYYNSGDGEEEEGGAASDDEDDVAI